MAILNVTRRDPTDWVHEYLIVASMVKTYDQVIHPIPDESTWPKTQTQQVLHPINKRKPGKPKKNRRRDPEEGLTKPKRSSRGHCSRYKRVGHNIRGCKQVKVSLKNKKRAPKGHQCTVNQVWH